MIRWNSPAVISQIHRFFREIRSNIFSKYITHTHIHTPIHIFTYSHACSLHYTIFPLIQKICLHFSMTQLLAIFCLHFSMPQFSRVAPIHFDKRIFTDFPFILAWEIWLLGFTPTLPRNWLKSLKNEWGEKFTVNAKSLDNWLLWHDNFSPIFKSEKHSKVINYPNFLNSQWILTPIHFRDSFGVASEKSEWKLFGGGRRRTWWEKKAYMRCRETWDICGLKWRIMETSFEEMPKMNGNRHFYKEFGRGVKVSC